MRIELVRHGRTRLQEEHRYVGSTDDPLSLEGARGLSVARTHPKQVYVTTLQRTAQTAAIIWPDAEQIVVPGLEEMDFGVFEGHTHAELEDDSAYRDWLDSGCKERCPGGEKLDEYCERVCTAFSQLLDDAAPRGERALTIVAHGGTMMAVMDRFCTTTRPFFDWQLPWGCGYLLDAANWSVDHTLRLVTQTDHRLVG